MEMSRPEATFYEADQLIEAGKISEAAELLYQLLKDHPDFGRAYNHLGYIYETKYRDLQKAEEFYRKCLELSPEYPAIYLNYSILLSGQGRLEELEELLHRALACPGINRAKIYNEFGIMHEIRGAYDLAVDAYKAAVQFSFVETDIAAYKNSIVRVRKKQSIIEEKDDLFGGPDPLAN
ncbi:MAG: tetratricopeptide repeat protein [Bacteroidota bacterium]